MRVLMQLRSDWEKIGGGDVEQVRETASALRSLGVKVDIEPSLAAHYRDYDIVHLFNTTRINETWQQFRAARIAGCPVAVSPIWHSMAEMRRYYAFRHGLPWFPIWCYGGLREVFYARRSGFPLDLRSVFRYRNCQRKVANQANLLLPNSEAEYRILEAELATRGQLVRVIHYGFNLTLARQAANQCDKRQGIVCAGRIEPRKNSCGVIRAFRRLAEADQTLSFFGGLNEAHGTFCEEFRALLEPGRISYGGRVPIDEIYHKFAAAEVVVLASFCETCGMVALEALACGAKVVVMDSPYTREYYRDAVFYCDPYDETSIAKAMSDALRSAPRPAPNWIENYTWDRAGRLTLQAYEQVLEGK